MEITFKILKEIVVIQYCDVEQTEANTTDLKEDYDYRPNTDIVDGVSNFVNWYNEYYLKC